MPAVGLVRGALPWLLFGGVFLGVGIVIGQWLPPLGLSLLPARAPVWTEAAVAGPAAPLGTVGLPTLAPLVDKVSGGVVTVRAYALADADRPDSTPVRQDEMRGSGFVIHEDGLILTNQHLVAGKDEILVGVPGHRAARARLVGEDTLTDLAVLRLETVPDDLVPLALGDSSKVRQGDWVMTFGNPLRFPGTVTVGVVSFVGRHLPERGRLITNEFLQFSAAVNPGSSGSPVLDMGGNVVGITTRSHTEAQGISFAVPSKVVKWVLAELQSPEGRARRAHLGIDFRPVDRALASEYGLPEGTGARIGNVRNGSPAAEAGLRGGDVIVGYDGRSVTNAHELYDWITYSRPGTRTELEILRPGDGRRRVAVTLGEVPAAAETERGSPQ